MIAQFTDSDGHTYRTQTELARGGEGIILTVAGRTDVVVKRYLDGQATPERAAKLRAMLADPPRDEMRERFKHASITWPLAILHEGRRFAGFLMPRIDGGSSLLNAYNPRAREFLGLDWSGQHHVAKNLCTALHALHLKGYVMGDVNQRNILVTAQGLVTLVDTDSFQVRAGGTLYRCPVGVPEYTPRELQGQRFDQVDRMPEHDRFGLAVLLFQLLMDGYHPFGGAPTNPDRSVGKVDEWCIRNGIFPWRPHPDFGKPRAARPLEALAPGLRDLFVRCFVNGHAAPTLRPTPKEWLDALHAAQQALVRCAAGTHWCHPAGGPCHACQARQRKSGAARAPNRTRTGPQARTKRRRSDRHRR
ncbi:hypothetical protein, partial [uncultured Thiodictyon sp.]|uniref:helix-hairpin-helix domain-containing protein n=1 Tax=uncultured Thiodictyon sp. TaxID=1846217 RepID=UPI0025DE5D94